MGWLLIFIAPLLGPPPVLFLECGPLVVFPFPRGQRELHFHSAILEVERQGHQGQAFLRHLADQAPNLLAMEKELALAARVVVVARRRVIGTDVRVDQEDLPSDDLAVSILQAGFPGLRSSSYLAEK